jgi:hypothetical protein
MILILNMIKYCFKVDKGWCPKSLDTPLLELLPFLEQKFYTPYSISCESVIKN